MVGFTWLVAAYPVPESGKPHLTDDLPLTVATMARNGDLLLTMWEPISPGELGVARFRT
jgi:hypothetical protein